MQETYRGLIQMHKCDGRAISKHEPYPEAPKSGQSQSPYRFTVLLTIEEEGSCAWRVKEALHHERQLLYLSGPVPSHWKLLSHAF